MKGSPTLTSMYELQVMPSWFFRWLQLDCTWSHSGACAICYYLYNSKNVKNTHGSASVCNLTKGNTLLWVFFTFFKLYRWYQISQSINNVSINRRGTKRVEVMRNQVAKWLSSSAFTCSLKTSERCVSLTSSWCRHY